jgi:hypothetical protein
MKKIALVLVGLSFLSFSLAGCGAAGTIARCSLLDNTSRPCN